MKSAKSLHGQFTQTESKKAIKKVINILFNLKRLQKKIRIQEVGGKFIGITSHENLGKL
jgi:hypothetical protein